MTSPSTLPRPGDRPASWGPAMAAPSAPWKASLEWDAPGATLVIEYRGVVAARDVVVLLDGVPAAEQPTVYSAPDTSGAVEPDDHIRIAFVLVDDAPQFEVVEILWEDPSGCSLEYAVEV